MRSSSLNLDRALLICNQFGQWLLYSSIDEWQEWTGQCNKQLTDEVWQVMRRLVQPAMGWMMGHERTEIVPLHRPGNRLPCQFPLLSVPLHHLVGAFRGPCQHRLVCSQRMSVQARCQSI